MNGLWKTETPKICVPQFSYTTVQSCDEVRLIQLRDPETEATTAEVAQFASIQTSPASLLYADQCKSSQHLSQRVMSGDHPTDLKDYGYTYWNSSTLVTSDTGVREHLSLSLSFVAVLLIEIGNCVNITMHNRKGILIEWLWLMSFACFFFTYV